MVGLMARMSSMVLMTALDTPAGSGHHFKVQHGGELLYCTDWQDAVGFTISWNGSMKLTGWMDPKCDVSLHSSKQLATICGYCY